MFVVGSNNPGFMPDSDPAYHRLLDDAREHLKWDLQNDIDYAVENGDIENVEKAEKALADFLASDATECNVYAFDRVYWITREITENETLLAEIIREPFAFPGGYEKYALTSDGGALCHECCKAESALIGDCDPEDTSGWRIVALDVNWEGDLFCDHCGESIGPEYSE